MSIPLPLMNNLCKRWILPPHIQQNCDLYYLRNYEDNEFVQLLEVFEAPEEVGFYIPEYGIRFRVIFQHDALATYVKNGELAKRNEPNNTRYWLSFRSLTFLHNGLECTKSYVLVQVDKGQRKEQKEVRGQEPERSGATLVFPSSLSPSLSSPPKIFNPNQVKIFNSFSRNSFADKSQPREKDETPEIDEEV
jgi:hypothetical protein